MQLYPPANLSALAWDHNYTVKNPEEKFLHEQKVHEWKQVNYCQLWQMNNCCALNV